MPSPGDSGPKPALPEAVKAYGKYYLVRKLAEGGMAEIFLAKQVGAEGFERNVVIKRMLQNLSSVPDFVGMFLDEARLAARLAHQNIIQINDLGLTDGCYYICMEYLPGEDFSTILRTASKRREYVPLPISVRIVVDAARGLDFAHNFTDEQGKPLNIVHRDISPSNIYVTYQGQVKVLDFGIAKAESRITQTTAGVVKGKYMYMSPEQAGTGVVDRRADVFSLGVTLYEALTNTRPFARDSDLAILNAVLKGEYKPLREQRRDLPDELAAIVTKALARKKEERYASCSELAADLEKWLGTSTSASGGSQITNYLTNLFGPERVGEKTRVPSLANLAEQGVDVPGYTNPKAPKTEPPARSPLAPEAATLAGSRTVMEKPAPARRSPVAFVAIAAAFGLIAGASALVAFRYLGGEVKGTVGPVSPTVAAPVDAGPPPAAITQAKPDSGEATVAVAPPPQPKEHAIVLKAGDVERVIHRDLGSIMSCFQTYKGDLTTDSGDVKVSFTILNSGKVANPSTEGPLAGSHVGGCLEKKFALLRFPLNKNVELRPTMPLHYEIQR